MDKCNKLYVDSTCIRQINLISRINQLMMKPFISFSFLLLFLWCVSAQTTSTAADGDKRYYVPEGWEDAGVSGPLDVHDVIFAVKYDVEVGLQRS